MKGTRVPAVRPGAVEPPSLPGGLLLPVLPGALCKGRDAALWFPVANRSPAKAKAVCKACPGREPCLDWALSTNERTGVWGGTTPEERAAIRRARRRQAS